MTACSSACLEDGRLKRLAVLALVSLAALPALAQKNAAERLTAASTVMNEVMAISDKSIPQSLLEQATCIVVIPNLKKGGFILGAKYGRGFFACRKESGKGWSAPASVKAEGGNIGFLIGASETDVIMIVKSQKGANGLLNSKFTLGGDASVAAGPVGRDASAQTDASFRAEILTYSRSRGVFGGVSLSGSTLRPDDEANQELYGHQMSNKAIITGDTPVPPDATAFIATLDKYSLRK